MFKLPRNKNRMLRGQKPVLDTFKMPRHLVWSSYLAPKSSIYTSMALVTYNSHLEKLYPWLSICASGEMLTIDASG